MLFSRVWQYLASTRCPWVDVEVFSTVVGVGVTSAGEDVGEKQYNTLILPIAKKQISPSISKPSLNLILLSLVFTLTTTSQCLDYQPNAVEQEQKVTHSDYIL